MSPVSPAVSSKTEFEKEEIELVYTLALRY
jgi:hypothetical protein